MPESQPPPSLGQQRREFAQRRFLAVPLAGAIAWTAIGLAGALLSPFAAVIVLFIGTGSIVYLAMLLARFTGEDFFAVRKQKNTFDTLWLLVMAMSILMFAIAIPFFRADYTSLPLTVGILTGAMWLPMSWLIEHWIGVFHAIARAVLVLGCWYLFPDSRFVAIPAVIVAIYLVSIWVLERRWRVLRRIPRTSSVADFRSISQGDSGSYTP